MLILFHININPIKSTIKTAIHRIPSNFNIFICSCLYKLCEQEHSSQLMYFDKKVTTQSCYVASLLGKCVGWPNRLAPGFDGCLSCAVLDTGTVAGGDDEVGMVLGSKLRDLRLSIERV